MTKRLLALLLVMVMAFALMSTAALAAKVDTAVVQDETENEEKEERGFGFRYKIGNIDYNKFVSWISDIFALVEEYSFEGLALVIANGIGILFFNK